MKMISFFSTCPSAVSHSGLVEQPEVPEIDYGKEDHTSRNVVAPTPLFLFYGEVESARYDTDRVSGCRPLTEGARERNCGSLGTASP